MGYVNLGSLGSDSIAVSNRRPSVLDSIENRRPEVVLADEKKLEAAYKARMDHTMAQLRFMQRLGTKQLADMAAWIEPYLPYGALGQSPEDGAAVVNQFRELLAGAIQELQGLPLNEQTALGRHLIVARAANASAELGFAITPRDLSITALDDLLWLSQDPSMQLGLEGTVADYNGRQMATSYKNEGESFSTLLQVSNSLRQQFGAPSGATVRAGLANMAVLAEGTGLRGVVENAIGPEVGKYLNTATIGKALGAVTKIAGAIESKKPGAIVSSIGNTVSTIGGSIPGPYGAVISAVGTVISMIGSFIDWLMGREPMPPLIPCIQAKADAWACLRLYLAATKPDLSDNVGISLLRNSGWDVQTDIFTGEIMVKLPEQNLYRRILDVFPREKLYKWYTEGDLREWIKGNRKIKDSYWDIMTGGNKGGYGLYCLTQPSDVTGRFICADYTSSGVRFRVHAKKDSDQPLDKWKGHGPTASAYDGGEVFRDDGFEREYRAAVFASAFLGGTMPYGRVCLTDGCGICTGVGGSYEGIPEDGSLKVKRPIMCRWDSKSNEILVIHPTEKPRQIAEKDIADGAMGKEDRAKKFPLGDNLKYQVRWYASGSKPSTAIRATEFFAQVLQDGNFRVKNRIPSPSPAAVTAPPATMDQLAAAVGARTTGTAATTTRPPTRPTATRPTVTRPVPTATRTVRVTLQPQGVKASGPAQGGMSTGAKVGIGLGVSAALAAGGYLVYRKLRKN